MSGISVNRVLQSLTHFITIIFNAVKLENKVLEKGKTMSSNGVGYLVKPFEMEDLIVNEKKALG